MKRMLLLLCLCAAWPGLAHHVSYPLAREIRIEALPEATQLTIRIPALLLYAPAAAERAHASAPIDAPFIEMQTFEEQPMYGLDTRALAEDPKPLLPLIRSVLPLEQWQDGPARIQSARALPETGDPLRYGRWLPVSEAMVEVVLQLPPGTDVVLLPMDAPPPLPHDWHMETLVEDARRTPSIWQFRVGPLSDPIRAEAP